jgi:predicted DNA-binding transcriptional regulator YafY
MSQRQQLERLFEIDRQIRAGLYPTADKLARDLEVSRRVIFNDRTFMADRLGAPIAFDRDRGGWYYTEATFVLPTVMVTEGELLAFFLTVELAKRYLGTALESPLRTAAAKIAKGLTGPVSVDLNVLGQNYTFEAPHSAPSSEATLMELNRAIRNRRLVAMRYYTASRNARSERTVEPYHLYNHDGDWYLIAFDRGRKKFLYFHVGRIERMKVLDQAYGPRRDFDPSAFLGQAFQVQVGETPREVAVHFDAKQAPYMRNRQWHATQRVSEHKDGSLTLRFTTSGLEAVVRWVLQYGTHAEVLAPKELRERVAEEARALAKAYGPAKRGPKKP